MGFGEMLGVKSVALNIKGKYTLDDLFEKIKDVDFKDAGQPGIFKHGGNRIIAFPKIDRENQVWIQANVMGKNKGGFSVMRSTIIASEDGIGGAIANEAIADIKDKLTFGYSGIKSTFGSPKKKCMADVDTVAEIIDKLGI